MPAIELTQCKECARPISLHWSGQMAICVECALRLQAQTEAAACQDAAQRRACLEYAEMQKLAAWSRGGYFPDLVPSDVTPARVPAYRSDQPPGVRPRKTGRRRGRPALHPSDRLVNFTMRLPLAVNDKLKRLGRDWLVAQVMAARQSA